MWKFLLVMVMKCMCLKDNTKKVSSTSEKNGNFKFTELAVNGKTGFAFLLNSNVIPSTKLRTIVKLFKIIFSYIYTTLSVKIYANISVPI